MEQLLAALGLKDHLEFTRWAPGDDGVGELLATADIGLASLTPVVVDLRRVDPD